MSNKHLAHHRAKWKSHTGFLLASIGAAIGLGNIWRFPYLCYKNGGGAFLIPYFIALFTVGIPLMILEIGIGHKMRGSAPASFASVSKKWEWIGWWQVIFVMFGIQLYYSVVIGWCINYFVYSFNLSWGTDTAKFFFDNFLQVSSALESKNPFELGNLVMPIFLSLGVVWFLCWLIVFKGVQKGLERANKIFMPLLFVLMFLVVIWSVRLPGAKDGIAIYLTPNFQRLKDPKVWMDAFGQIFFSLGLGFGIMTAYASYLPTKSQITRNSFIIGIVNCVFSIFAGFGVFAVLGYMAHSTGKPFSEVVGESIGLAFVVYPKVISMMPHFGSIFGILFFAALTIAGLSSAVSIVEAFTSAGIDKFHYKRENLVSVLCVVGFFGSIIFAMQGGLLWLDIVDHFIMQYGLIVSGLFECLLIGWVYSARKLRVHINKHSISQTYWIWDIFVCWIIPLILVVLIVQAIITEVTVPYGGYTWLSIILIGRDWLLYTLFAGIIVATYAWRTDPRERMIQE